MTSGFPAITEAQARASMPASRFGHFDADVYAAAQEAPTLVVGRYLYRGRLLDIEEWLRYAEEIDRLREQDKRAADRVAENAARAARGEDPLPPIIGARPREYVALYRRYLRAVFPRRRYRFWASDPVADLMAKPWGTVTEAITRFFALQARASTPTTSQTTTTPATRGTDSPPSTASEPAAPTAMG